MHKLTCRTLLTVLAGLVVLGSVPAQALADGNETLGPPSLAVSSGSGMVAAGTGTVSQPATINVTVPAGALVNQVLLYWEGFSAGVGDDTIRVNGTPVTGVLIGGPTLFFGAQQSSSYRADITALGLVGPGANSLTIDQMDFDGNNDGAGILVIFDHPASTAEILLHDGNDLAFQGFSPPLDTTVPQTFNFTPLPFDRLTSIVLCVGSVQANRPNVVRITVDGSTVDLVNILGSFNGPQWDTANIPFFIPGNVSSLTVQLLSQGDGVEVVPASLAWVAAGMAVPVPCDPTLTCPDSVTIQCGESTDPAHTGEPTATDNCDPNPTVTYSDAFGEGECPIITTITRTWTALFASGVRLTCTQTITVVDGTDPVITCPSDLTVQCHESTLPDNTGTPTVTDNCDPQPAVRYSDVFEGSGLPCAGSITRTWTATDACGNEASCQQTITILDTTAPEITCPADVTIECTGSTDPTNTGLATATDNCGDKPELSFNDSSVGDCPTIITRTWTATDLCQNVATCQQTITIDDTLAPTLQVPADVTVECSESTEPSNTGQATATDDCDPDPAVSFTDDVEPGSCGAEIIITRTWTATDACGNTAGEQSPGSQFIQIITVEDTTPPELVVPPDVTVQCHESTDTANTGQATATDNCDANPTVTYSDAFEGGSCPNEWTLIRTWTATDNCGNTTGPGGETGSVQFIYVVDTTPPTLTVPPDVTVECDQPTDMSATGEATAVDNCEGEGEYPAEVTHSDSVAPGDCEHASVITRTWTATDVCGNTTSQDQIITVVDTTPPTINVPEDMELDVTVECDAPIDPIDLGEPTASDNCDNDPELTHVDTITPGDSPQEVTITRTWTATDACGNSASVEQIIRVVDTTAPIIINCPGTLTFALNDGCELVLPSPAELEVSATDNCTATENLVITLDPANFGPENVGLHEVTVTVWDEAGNAAVCVVTITIEIGECGGPGPQPVPPGCDPNAPGLNLLMSAIMRAPVCGLGCPLMMTLCIFGLVVIKVGYLRPRRRTLGRRRDA